MKQILQILMSNKYLKNLINYLRCLNYPDLTTMNSFREAISVVEACTSRSVP